MIGGKRSLDGYSINAHEASTPKQIFLLSRAKHAKQMGLETL